jgi:hypothetical protein
MTYASVAAKRVELPAAKDLVHETHALDRPYVTVENGDPGALLPAVLYDPERLLQRISGVACQRHANDPTMVLGLVRQDITF